MRDKIRDKDVVIIKSYDELKRRYRTRSGWGTEYLDVGGWSFTNDMIPLCGTRIEVIGYYNVTKKYMQYYGINYEDINSYNKREKNNGVFAHNEIRFDTYIIPKEAVDLVFRPTD